MNDDYLRSLESPGYQYGTLVRDKFDALGEAVGKPGLAAIGGLTGFGLSKLLERDERFENNEKLKRAVNILGTLAGAYVAGTQVIFVELAGAGSLRLRLPALHLGLKRSLKYCRLWKNRVYLSMCSPEVRRSCRASVTTRLLTWLIKSDLPVVAPP